jgi:hypothetical protein
LLPGRLEPQKEALELFLGDGLLGSFVPAVDAGCHDDFEFSRCWHDEYSEDVAAAEVLTERVDAAGQLMTRLGLSAERLMEVADLVWMAQGRSPGRVGGTRKSATILLRTLSIVKLGNCQTQIFGMVKYG